MHPETWRKVSILLWLISNLFHSEGMPTRLALSAVSGSSEFNPQSVVKGFRMTPLEEQGLAGVSACQSDSPPKLHPLQGVP